ncbi:hypothetical protein GYMLUDRAFT_51375 [Collybiopsis luxurians FD-317 M1]|uniref:Guanine nucleotide-binding protein alpha-4 subunit n=1 Tax=Collybiopsis luxurians FD-317 M1 TaxID=944289 RepID=A0A0D0AIY6_9AGAR|nr:hypothetical protein GYMLUDRAFT_51375 [Collybiopsis luxurians FD-317 M1]
MKILLLGQSESGKSTTLKNFRLAYARDEWEAEKASWRAVIQLNLVRCIASILNALQAEINGDSLSASELDDIDSLASRGSIDMTANDNDSNVSEFSPEELQYLQTFRLRLAPLRRVEMVLRFKLGAGTEEIKSMEESPGSSSDSGQEIYSTEAPDAKYFVRLRKSRQKRIQGDEMVVRGLRWRELLSSNRKRSLSEHNIGMDTKGGPDAMDVDVVETLAACREDMKLLWQNQTMRSVLKKRGIEMENNAGFFLNDIDRIASTSYIPSDDDVVRSRLRTLGVQEYRINVVDQSNTFNKNGPSGREWILYDVGGSRTMRRAWIPFFEDVNAIIFLAPVSCFDEVLLEDSSINRLNDSVALWKAIISSKLLQKTTMICFLNKCDILKRKLKSGTRFARYVREYGDRPNDITPVVKYIKERFRNIAIKYSIEKRTTYIYTTSVTDTKATAATLQSVRDSIFRTNLSSAQMV